MKREKCKGTTKEGLPCNNYATKNSEYCWVHKLLKKRGGYKNTTIKIAMAMLPLTIPLAVAYYWQMKTERRIDQISPPLQRYEEKSQHKLSQEYPLGYVLLWYNKKGGSTSTLVRTHPTCKWLIDPNSMKVTIGSSEVIHVRPPNIVHATTLTEISDNVFEFPRVIGEPQRIGIVPADLQMWFEILVDDTEKLICLIGFREKELSGG